MNQRLVTMVVLGLAVAAGGCAMGQGKQASEAMLGSTSQALSSDNGLNLTNGLTSNGLNLTNGLTSNGLNLTNGLTSNGLNLTNGLTSNGLTSNGLTITNALTSNALTSNGLSIINRLSASKMLSTVDELSTNKRLSTMDGVKPSGHWLANALRPKYGLNVAASLASDQGLADGQGLMANDGGRTVVSYLTKCALPPGSSLTKYDADGGEHVFEGAIGVAPEWESGACGSDCQEWVSACLLAHVNLTGKHVSIWLTADSPAIDWSTSDDYSAEEAAFFGNLFTPKPEAYVCFGRDVMTNSIAGRVCVGQQDCPYYDPYVVRGGSCDAGNACRAHTGADGQGYENCQLGNTTWSHVVTTWKPAQ